MKIYGTNVHSLKNFLKKIELTAHPKPAKAINLPPTSFESRISHSELSYVQGSYNLLALEKTKASRFYWRSRKLSVSLLLALEKTQRLASIGARENSASRFYWRSRKLSVSLLLALDRFLCTFV
ncbi:hypothetical protein LEP1GSC038_1328 [Leptospira weilii str. 2006001855]|uniref:Uncharacterized protein n=1 Tax=Leptospira weilii str. 2006001855 TaxID=996804 RepID=M6FKT2_9LEPT|nr:hypothetical protein LEP1GSC038_1328 [Leptospira weilii str. 2006001855]